MLDLFASAGFDSTMAADKSMRRRRFAITLERLRTMARRYDASTTTFSPEGRLHQVR
jgi:hypothetical protein